jgi:aryl-alcohol dehydrogenase-like predicted oxidoreductase
LLKMKYLGWSGVRVSEICLGTMTFGWRADEKESHRMLNLFVENGGNFIDTADVYGEGESERIIGGWLRGVDRDEMVIATKVRFRSGKGANDIGLTRKHIISAVKQSLRRLGTDYIDLYQVHAWDPATPLEETLQVLTNLVEEGYVRYIGASNFRGWQLQKALDISRSMGLERFLSLQPQYSLLCRATEFELLPLCRAEKVGVLPWSPLKGGWLTGKYTRDMQEPPENTRIGERFREGERERWYSVANERTWALLDALREIALTEKKTVSQIALNWVMSKKEVTSPIIGASNSQQLLENLGASGWSLSREQMELLDRLSSIDPGYPYDERAEMQQRAGREDFELP